MIPENFIESELFGYESGAFTNKGGKIGKIELANNGTLFLDEIGELPLRVQVKLLDFLQDRQIDRVGGTKKVKINTRVVAATNRDLLQMVHEGHFRKDLYYRLNVVPIVIPPLRERKEDIPALVKYFLDKFNAKYGLNKKLTPEILQAFYHYEWPGNVRELEHVMERIIVIVFGLDPKKLLDEEGGWVLFLYSLVLPDADPDVFMDRYPSISEGYAGVGD